MTYNISYVKLEDPFSTVSDRNSITVSAADGLVAFAFRSINSFRPPFFPMSAVYQYTDHEALRAFQKRSNDRVLGRRP